MALWTQRIRLRWQQNLSFYERRYDVLRALEADGALRRFRHEDDRVVVRLGSAHQSLSFGANGMNLSRLAPDADADLLRSAASIVWERLEPHLIGPPIVSFQFLQPLSSSYDEAKIQAARQLVGADVTNALDDFALLLDGRDEALGARYRLELGVLSAADGPQRLARVVGRVGGAEAETPPSLWRPDTLPKVAFFCDQEWETKALDGDGSLDAVFSQVSAVLDSANELVDRFVSRLGLEDLEG